jgi:hypothetical protein
MGRAIEVCLAVVALMLLGYAHALPTGLLGSQYLYVTSGIGTSGVRLRWRVPPEFVVLDVIGPPVAAISTVGAATGCLSASTA